MRVCQPLSPVQHVRNLKISKKLKVVVFLAAFRSFFPRYRLPNELVKSAQCRFARVNVNLDVGDGVVDGFEIQILNHRCCCDPIRRANLANRESRGAEVTKVLLSFKSSPF